MGGSCRILVLLLTACAHAPGAVRPPVPCHEGPHATMVNGIELDVVDDEVVATFPARIDDEPVVWGTVILRVASACSPDVAPAQLAGMDGLAEASTAFRPGESRVVRLPLDPVLQRGTWRLSLLVGWDPRMLVFPDCQVAVTVGPPIARRRTWRPAWR